MYVHHKWWWSLGDRVPVISQFICQWWKRQVKMSCNVEWVCHAFACNNQPTLWLHQFAPPAVTPALALPCTYSSPKRTGLQWPPGWPLSSTWRRWNYGWHIQPTSPTSCLLGLNNSQSMQAQMLTEDTSIHSTQGDPFMLEVRHWLLLSLFTCLAQQFSPVQVVTTEWPVSMV